MFKLTNQIARVANFNPRAEKHGEENVLAADIKLEVDAHSSTLDVFDPALRPLLYRAPAAGEQPKLDFGNGDNLTALRLPHLAPLKLDAKFPGYRLSIDSGLGISEPLVLTEVELSAFVFEAVDGGSVKITLRATCHPDADQSGQLCTLIGDDIEVTLTPPEKIDPAQIEISQSSGEEDPDDDAERVLITAFAVEQSGSTHLYSVTAELSDASSIDAGEYAYRPSIDDVLGYLATENGLDAQVTNSARQQLEEALDRLTTRAA